MPQLSTAPATPSWRRAPLRAVAAAYLEHAPSICGSLVLSVLANRFSHGQVGQVAWVVLAAVACVRLIVPVGTWWYLRLQVDDSGLWTRTGLLHHRTRFTPWTSVAAFDVDSPWHHRVLGLRRVELRQGGDDGTRVRVDALLVRDVDHVVAAVSSARVGSSAPSPAVTPVALQAPSRTPVFVASWGDLVLASLVYGRFATIGGAAALGGLEVLSAFGLLPGLRGGSAPATAAVAVAVALFVLVSGATATVLRYAGLSTYLTEEGLLLRHGLLSVKERHLDAEAVVGAELRRTLLEVALGRARLTLLTRDSNAGLGANLVLPSLPEDVVRRIVGGPLGERVAVGQVWEEGSRVDAARRMAAFAALVLTLPALLCLGLLAVGLPLLAVVPVAVAALLLTAYVGRVLRTTVRVERGGTVVAARTSSLDQRCTTVRRAAVEAATSWTLPGGGIVSRVQVYAGGARSLTTYGRTTPSLHRPDDPGAPSTTTLEGVAR